MKTARAKMKYSNSGINTTGPRKKYDGNKIIKYKINVTVNGTLTVT